MKLERLILALCLSFSVTGHSQSSSLTQPPPLRPSDYRVVDGKIYNATHDARWVVGNGKVVQVLDGGLLVQMRGNIAFLKNHPQQSSLLDGSRIQFTAMSVGRHQYENTGGALRTVAAYDCGQRYQPPPEGKEKPRIEPVQVRTHVVKRGETLARIGIIYYVNPRSIMRANNLQSDQLTAGMRLIIPNE